LQSCRWTVANQIENDPIEWELKETCEAIVYHKYGSPDVLELREIDKPVVKDDEVLVRIHASSVNPAEWHTMTGLFVARTQLGLLRPKNTRLGADFAGVVEAVGSGVTQFQTK